MSKKIYKFSLELESSDPELIVATLHSLADDIEDGRQVPGSFFAGTSLKVSYYPEDRCEYCDGTGEVATDEDDGEGHTMRGVGTQKCICQNSSKN